MSKLEDILKAWDGAEHTAAYQAVGDRLRDLYGPRVRVQIRTSTRLHVDIGEKVGRMAPGQGFLQIHLNDHGSKKRSRERVQLADGVIRGMAQAAWTVAGTPDDAD